MMLKTPVPGSQAVTRELRPQREVAWMNLMTHLYRPVILVF